MVDLEGLRFGKLKVVRRSHKDKWRSWHWVCLCGCGNITKSSSRVLRAGKKKSCGCLYNRPLKERLLKRIENNQNGCWIWLGSKTTDGYGTLMTANKVRLLTHRAAYEIFVSPIPRGLCVCHDCDTPSCINPDHLFLGTHAENMKDMAAKGRAPGRRKLSLSDYERIIKLRAEGRSRAYVAKIFGVSKITITRVTRSIKEKV